MKAQVMDIPSSLFGSTASRKVAGGGAISKSRREVDAEEIQACLYKLRDLVPNVPRNKKLSKLEIIQSVIDYIVDLQCALDMDPETIGTQLSAPTSNNNHHRQPLGSIPTTPNTILNLNVL